MCSTPFPGENEARCKRNWTASGANRRSRKRWLSWPSSKPSTANAIGEAVRSLAEDEENTFTFFAFPQRMHRHIQTTNAIESLAEQCERAHRSDRRLHAPCPVYFPLSGRRSRTSA